MPHIFTLLTSALRPVLLRMISRVSAANLPHDLDNFCRNPYPIYIYSVFRRSSIALHQWNRRLGRYWLLVRDPRGLLPIFLRWCYLRIILVIPRRVTPLRCCASATISFLMPGTRTAHNAQAEIYYLETLHDDITAGQMPSSFSEHQWM
ncbi:hypothetical protein F5B21DRAFT_451252 [Xylaria acuta]|nr:hypothetical protein F5B21DRAFT_451252 [Xylaria acuta]